jgi:hypothetical protein
MEMGINISMARPKWTKNFEFIFTRAITLEPSGIFPDKKARVRVQKLKKSYHCK